MTGLNLSDETPAAPDGIGGRFLIGWKTLVVAIGTVLLSIATLERRQAVTQAELDQVKAQHAQAMQQLNEQNTEVRQELRELRQDVKQLLMRRP